MTDGDRPSTLIVKDLELHKHTTPTIQLWNEAQWERASLCFSHPSEWFVACTEHCLWEIFIAYPQKLSGTNIFIWYYFDKEFPIRIRSYHKDFQLTTISDRVDIQNILLIMALSFQASLASQKPRNYISRIGGILDGWSYAICSW